jgi:hypothetical protein
MSTKFVDVGHKITWSCLPQIADFTAMKTFRHKIGSEVEQARAEIRAHTSWNCETWYDESNLDRPKCVGMFDRFSLLCERQISDRTWHYVTDSLWESIYDRTCVQRDTVRATVRISRRELEA